ncbi:MAG: LytR/AlgR family response regulator transcription factor [Gemmatimonadaceae bacterium]
MSAARSRDAARPARRVVVADDEALARERLRQLVSRHPGWEVVAECRNGPQAVEAILEQRPDVVFLDVRMPGLDGLEVAEAIAGSEGAEAPAVVFVTAYDAFALRAFEVSAADYLLKPVDRDRFARTMARLEARLAGAGDGGASAVAMDALLARLGTAPRYAQRFLVRSPKGYYFVQADDVEWVEAEGNYAALHAQGRVHLVRQTMKALEARLDPSRFVRVHRSAIVAAERIERVEPLGHGEYRLHLRGGVRVDSGRAYGARVQALLRG